MKFVLLLATTAIPVLFCQLGTEGVRTRGVLLKDGSIRIGADPEEPGDLVRLLADRQIAKLLSLDSSVADATQEFLEARRTDWMKLAKPTRGRVPESLAKAFLEEDAASSKAFLSEALDPDQLKRFKQLVYRMEIEAIGWKLSLTEGRLGSNIGVYDEQKAELERQISKIVVELRKKIEILNRDAEKEVLSLLVPEQRVKAEELIGPYTTYRHSTVVETKFDRLRDMRTERQDREKD